jgi:hypothetical protein
MQPQFLGGVDGRSTATEKVEYHISVLARQSDNRREECERFQFGLRIGAKRYG